jgi:uncharacterized Zn finger protein (UPF0148 family)
MASVSKFEAEKLLDGLIEGKVNAINKINDLLKKEKEAAPRSWATSRIEVIFNSKRRSRGLVFATFSFWRLSDGLRMKMYLCPTCRNPLPQSNVATSFCKSCHKVVDLEKEAAGEIVYRTPMQNLAEQLYKMFVKLGSSAELAISYPGSRDIRKIEQIIIEKGATYGDDLTRVRQDRTLVEYPLERIIKDLSTGADPVKVFRAFLEA